ncbi:hypothetical protein ASPZODRAFT_133744 [Penicilliopsis zonata CBS 506.65]|uniref:Zn(2)-C6 fungal-type domain-containing protein n=1 Tax=Penicilliopsis zonata CBS 506.65 TaxID=1073090 RepID=A0A1L9SFE3_9EURO|nr:hypothetical protein ASPZODRAFT_133744 [Penicilliopsis zonata CBS 506.65]OJJ45872.1 hypothetical protein ASPZODRAFT_133744 [Penicilliopsis zonata CBS 506.65]
MSHELDALLASNPPPAVRRRPRPPLSCAECRRRKLRCDRELPCDQCTKGLRVDRCFYQDPHRPPKRSATDAGLDQLAPELYNNNSISSGSNSNSNSNNNGNSHVSSGSPQAIDNLQSRISKLETLLLRQARTIEQLRADRTPGSQASTVAVATPVSSAPAALKRDYSRALLGEFNEALDFMKELWSDPAMHPTLNEFRLYHRQFHKQWRSLGDEEDRQRTGSAMPSAILALLPPRETCDRYVDFYCRYLENTYRILHTPSFMQEYEAFWAEGEGDRAAHFYSLIPQLAVVVAIAAALDGTPTDTDRVPERRLFDTVEDWLHFVDRRKSTPLATLRVHCLMLLARFSGADRTKRSHNLWVTAGDLIRFATTQSFHCDPSELPGVSIFEGEQRRRLWMTVREMDLQASIICGRSPYLQEPESTCWSPGNFHDLDLYEGMPEYPSPRPVDEWTGSSIQAALGRSLQLRLNAMRILGGLTQTPSRLDAALEAADQLERFIRGLPDVLQLQLPRSHQTDSPARLFSQILCDVHLRRPLLCLWQKLASSATSDRICIDARLGTLRSSLVFLTHRGLFDLGDAELRSMQTVAPTNLFYETLKADIMRASFGVCWEIKRRKRFPLHDLGLPDVSVALELASPKDPTVHQTGELVAAVDELCQFMMSNMGTLWRDVKNAFRLAVVLSSIQPAEGTETPQERMQRTTMQVLEACRKHDPFRQIVPNLDPSLADTMMQNENVALSTASLELPTETSLWFGEDWPVFPEFPVRLETV